MGRIRAGLKFNVGRHGRLWLPLGGRKPGCLSGVIWIFVLGFLITYWQKIKVVSFILLIAWILFLAFRYVIRLNRAEPETAALKIETNKKDRISYTVEGDINAAALSKLRELSFASVGRYGIKTGGSLDSNDTGLHLVLDGVTVGSFPPEMAAFINANFEKLKAFDVTHIYGGGTLENGEPAPYYISGSITLTEAVEPPEEAEHELRFAPSVWGVLGGSPCFVSRTGTAHNGHCGTGLYSCEPMTVQEAAAAGYKPCSKCFY